jgi:hypothetical protein
MADTTVEKTLMDVKNFRKAASIDSFIPIKCSGLYCIRISNISKLPNPFNTLLQDRGHNILYMGIATNCLNKRFLNQELRANGHGTFFRSLGAVLGYKPQRGSLITKSNKHNYKFSKEDCNMVINWINENLIVNWVKYSGNFESIETALIEKYQPLLNIAKNPSRLQLLSELRADCVRIANSN